MKRFYEKAQAAISAEVRKATIELQMDITPIRARGIVARLGTFILMHDTFSKVLDGVFCNDDLFGNDEIN
jgi:hypothetical protein